MPNIASILKEEIIRLARLEIRNELASLRKAVTAQRSEIAELKRRALATEKALRAPAASRVQSPAAPEIAAAPKSLRFSASNLAAQRQRLALSAEDFGLLIGATGKSIYRWETEQSRPRDSFLPAIANVRAMGKKEAKARLQTLKAPGT